MKPEENSRLFGFVVSMLSPVSLLMLITGLMVTAPASSPAAGPVIITEFMANNSSTLADEDGSFEDWIEIQNISTNTVNLLGWSLTDSANNLVKWQFPSTNLLAGQYMIVFASSKNRTTPGARLHTNFKLSNSGEYLALTDPTGMYITSQFAPAFPVQFSDVSYGLAQDRTDMLLVATNASCSVLIPTSEVPGMEWTLRQFDDSAWIQGTNGVGFDTHIMEPAEDSFSASVTNLAPLGYWRFNEPTGTVASNMGTLGATVAATYVGSVGLGQAGPRPPGQSGFETNNYAGQFNGSTTRVRIPKVPEFDFGTGPYTIAMWLNPANAATRGDLFTYKASGNDYGIHVASQTANTISVYHNGFIGTGGSLVNGQWHYLVVTRETGGKTTAWLNGVVLFTGTDSGSMSIAMDLLVGCNHSGTPDTISIPFNGLIDEVAIYNRALGTNEIQQQYRTATTSGATYTPLISTDIASQMSQSNSSAYIRIPFVVEDPSAINRLFLRMRYDDGFVAYINGVEATAVNAPDVVQWNSTATTLHPDSAAIGMQEFDIRDAVGALVTGTNILAIQGLNINSNNADFLIQAELAAIHFGSYGIAGRYFTVPTPGEPNGIGAVDLGPIITKAGFTPAPPVKPVDSDIITVTARVAMAFSPVTNVVLRYRVNYGAANEITMLDDGAHGDGAAGDGIFGATIPASASTPGQMVRFLVAAQDELGRSSRWPLFEDPLNSPEYLGTVIANPAVASQMPVWEWFTDNVANARNRTGARGSLWFNGQFYDNIYIRERGGYTSTGSQKFDFNSDNHLYVNSELGRVEEVNINATGSDPTYIRQAMAFETIRQSGSPASISFHVLMRLNGAADRVGILIEQVDKHFLSRNGFDGDGALYKFIQRGLATPVFSDVATGIEKKTRLDENLSDLQAFVTGLNQADPAAKRAWFFDNVNVPNFLNYCAARSIIQDADDVRKNFYWHRDTLGNKEWSTFPWDKDWTFGVVGDGGAGLPHPFFGDYAHRKPSGDQWNLLYEFVFNDPVTQPLMLRRLRTVMDKLLQPPGTPATNGYLEKRAIQWMGPVAAELGATVSNQISSVMSYLTLRRTNLYITYAATNLATGATNTVVPLPVPTNALPAIGRIDYNPISHNQAEEFIELTNPTSYAIDISGWKLEGAVQLTFQPGTIIPAFGSLFASPDVNAFRARAVSPRGGMGLFVQGNYKGLLSAWGETVQLKNDAGLVISQITYPGTPSPAQQFLRITEIMYNPAPLSGSPIDAQDFEYIELMNTSTNVTLDLVGVHFTNGINFTFDSNSPIATLPPGGRVLVVANTAAFAIKYGNSLPVAGQYEGTLDNGGEQITLMDAMNEKILDFNYNNSWYPMTDRLGFALVITDPYGSISQWDSKAGWKAGSQFSGTPGSSEIIPVYAPVLITEALTRMDAAPSPDMVELYNPNDAPVNIGGWFLTDDFFTYYNSRIPDGTIIGAHCYMVFNETQLGFGLNSSGESIYLMAADAGGNLTGYFHGYDFGGAENGVTFGRYVTSDNRDLFVAQSSATLGTNNAGPLVGPVVISEVMYHPPFIGGTTNDDEEFIELANITTNIVPLFDPATLTNTWHIRGGVDFDFPPNAVLNPGQFALVVGFDPADSTRLSSFRWRYSIGTNVPVFGPYSGKINNGGDNIELKKPTLYQGVESFWVLVDQLQFAAATTNIAGADGAGASLQRKDLLAFGNDPINWAVSAGTPGASNLVPQAGFPVIWQQPQHVSVIMATQTVTTNIASFAITLASTQNVTYQWRHEGTNLPGQTNAWLTISNVALIHGGKYSVEIANGTGVTLSSDALLHLIISPSITRQPQSTAVSGGDAAFLSVDMAGTPPFFYQWRMYGTNLPGATNAALDIASATIWHDGLYSVVVSNLIASVTSSNATLSVRVPATIVAQPQSVTITNGSTNVIGTNIAILSVRALGMSALSYQWMLYGQDVPNATNATLIISNVSLTNAGYYSVRVSDSVQTVASSNALLTLLVKPFILVSPVNQAVPSGGTAVFSVLAGPVHPTLPLIYAWKRGSTIVASISCPTLVLTNVTNSALVAVDVWNPADRVFKSASLTLLADADRDGIPDTYETSMGWSTNSPNDAITDSDGDGMSNLQEYLAGTSPTNAASVLKLQWDKATNVASVEMKFQFTALSNKTYSVEYADGLQSTTNWQTLLSLDALLTNRSVNITNTLPTGVTNRFFRIRVPRNVN